MEFVDKDDLYLCVPSTEEASYILQLLEGISLLGSTVIPVFLW